ncbi:MAG: hypothetical protein AAF663_02765, partial [Planctomycetota bacterium]
MKRVTRRSEVKSPQRWLTVGAAAISLGFLSAAHAEFGPAAVPTVDGGETEMLDIEKDELKFG